MRSSHFTDPFTLKRLQHWDPRRLFPTLCFQYHDWRARRLFARCALPRLEPKNIGAGQALSDTSVTAQQYAVLGSCLRETAHLSEPCVEIGSFRGTTTRFLALHTARNVIAIDPFFGWGGCEADMAAFRRKTSDLARVTHLRLTSGEAALKVSRASFVFVDAVHDYANVRFDVGTYSQKLVTGGIVALHDADYLEFAGARLAIHEFLESHSEFSLLFHVHDLVAFQRSMHRQPDA